MALLESDRLILRPPNPSDIPGMAAWLGDYDVAKNLARVPHPYDEQEAQDFIAGLDRGAQTRARFTILRKADGIFMGGASLYRRGEATKLSYWLGKPFWGLGYATEAARRLAAHAFTDLGLERLRAGWFADNLASGHVLAKLGARHNGSAMRPCLARGRDLLCHDMLLTKAAFLSKRAA